MWSFPGLLIIWDQVHDHMEENHDGGWLIVIQLKWLGSIIGNFENAINELMVVDD